jgi:tight adherence protein C
MPLPVPVIVLIALLVIAVGVAVNAFVRDLERKAILDRAGTYSDTPILLRTQTEGLGSKMAKWIVERAPVSWRSPRSSADKLVHAGFDSDGAPVVFVAARIASAVTVPLIVLMIAPRQNALLFTATLAIAVLVGLILPQAFLNFRASGRQERMRRAIPDSLDLLVVCVEAGVSLDAAIMRVAKEMTILHPDFANELLIVHRRVNAGIPREQALRGLWERTGVEDLRGLAANMIQSEKWGTSIATVLRVYAESLRRKRKQLAEKRAATAPLKMTFPLAIFIFPAIFIVLLGPAIMKISAMFKSIAH